MTSVAEPRILIADDQHDLLDALRLLLKGEGIGMDGVTSPDAVVDAVEHSTYDLLLMDLNYTSDTTSGREGIDLLARVRHHDDMLPVGVMTGWGTVDLAVEAMRRRDGFKTTSACRDELAQRTPRARGDTAARRRATRVRRLAHRAGPAPWPQRPLRPRREIIFSREASWTSPRRDCALRRF